jgi:uncharacterized membrane protein YobD (UPF0266 family)
MMEFFVPIVLSLLVVFLFSAFLLCVAITATPFFVNQSNADEILPIAMKGAKLNVGMLVLSVILVLIAHNTVIGTSPLLKVSLGFLVWGIAAIFIVSARQKMIEKKKKIDE